MLLLQVWKRFAKISGLFLNVGSLDLIKDGYHEVKLLPQQAIPDLSELVQAPPWLQVAYGEDDDHDPRVFDMVK